MSQAGRGSLSECCAVIVIGTTGPLQVTITDDVSVSVEADAGMSVALTEKRASFDTVFVLDATTRRLHADLTSMSPRVLHPGSCSAAVRPSL